MPSFIFILSLFSSSAAVVADFCLSLTGTMTHRMLLVPFLEPCG